VSNLLHQGSKSKIDSDLAELYGLETRRLKEQVKRNIERFPKHYMFELTKEEAEVSRSQNATLKRGENIKYLPYVFTEHGVMMLANVLKSGRAIEVSMRIIDIFIKLREMLLDNTELRLAIEKLEKKTENNSRNIEIVFRYFDELTDKKEKPAPRKQIGYKVSNTYVQQVDVNKFIIRVNGTYTFMSKGLEVGSLSWTDVYTSTINSNLYPVNIPVKSKIISGTGVFLNATGKVTTLAKSNGDRLFDVKFDKKH
jgi:phage regulator Rha-like protein